MAVNNVKSTSQEAMDLIAARKAQILEKLKKGENEESIPTGGGSFTQTEWKELIEQMDKSLEETKKAQNERVEKQMKKWEEKLVEDKKEDQKVLLEEIFENQSLEAKRKAAIITEREEAGKENAKHIE